MTISEAKKKNAIKSNSTFLPSSKVSNKFIHNTIHSNNLNALKTIFYLASVLETSKFKKEYISTIELDLNKMLLDTGITAKDIRYNLVSMQKTSISFISEDGDIEEHINLLPYIKIIWGKNRIIIKLFDKIINQILEVKRDYTFLDIQALMTIKNKHTLRMLPLLHKLANYSDNVAKRIHLDLDALNEFFGTAYKRIIDIERKILIPIQNELLETSKLNFVYETQFDKCVGAGRPKAIEVTIDLKIQKHIQPSLNIK